VDVAVDGVDVRAAAVHVVDDARDCLALRRASVHAYLARVPQLAAVGVVARQIHQEVSVVPFLPFTSDQLTIAESAILPCWLWFYFSKLV